MATAAELKQLDDPLIVQISDQMQQGSRKKYILIMPWVKALIPRIYPLIHTSVLRIVLLKRCFGDEEGCLVHLNFGKYG